MIPQTAQTDPGSASGTGGLTSLPSDEPKVPVGLEAVVAMRKATESVYQYILEKQPADYRASLQLGYLARQRSDSAAALDYFKAARAADPRRTRPALEMAQELRTLARLDDAEALYQGLLEDRPRLVRALAGLGHIARARGEPRAALNHYQAALAIDPDRTDLKLKVAAQLRKLSRFREAQAIYRSVLEEEPDHDEAREQLDRLPRRERSELPPMNPAWLERDTFARAAEWGRNVEALGTPAFDLSLLALAEDIARGATEEVKDDCILLRLDRKTKVLPLVSDWEAFGRVLEREAAALEPGALLGCVPDQHEGDWRRHAVLTRIHREFVWQRETIAAMQGSSLRDDRRVIRKLQNAGARVEPIGPDNLDRVLACNERWYADRVARGESTYYRARTNWTLHNLEALHSLGVKHLAVVLEDDVIGYSVSSHLGTSWVAYFYGRGDRVEGLTPLMAQTHAGFYPEREWINAGDAGRSRGLAAMKQRFVLGAADKQISLGWIQA